ncbi:MAG TPA: FtsX-like permease family protein [Acidimicrobiia bacterium]|nr:FtsX-like permease family protein [Acidimicrobiia bacterium]
MGPVLLIAFSLPFVVIIVGSPMLRRLAVRNAWRRPVEAALVIGGSLLGTAIITGSLIVGDTIDRSIRAGAYDQLGPVDEIVAVPAEEGPELLERFDGFSSPSVDGVLALTITEAAVVNLGQGGGTQPRAQLIEVDFDAARRFGGDARATGIRGPTPDPGRAAVTVDVADRLGVERGSRITVFAAGANQTFVVDRVLDRHGVAGLWTVDPRQQSYNVFVTPGTTATLAADASTATLGAPPQAVLAFSNTGGVEEGATRTRAATEAIAQELSGADARVQRVKHDLLERADESAQGLSDFYFTIGMFAVAAGIVLLVNVFVMLADERRSELGLMRAMGLRRSTLVGAMATEGWLYSIAAGALGAILGIGVGWVIARRASDILGSGQEVNALRLTFAFDTSTVISGFAVGTAISVVTIVASSVRNARFNVIRAIRDIPTPQRTRPRRRWTLLGIPTTLVGVAATVAGVSGPDPYLVMAGPMLVAAGLTPIASRLVAPRAVTTGVCLAVLVWAVGCFGVLAALDATIEIPLFLLQGLTMAGAAVVLVTTYLGRMGRVLDRGGRTLTARLGVAYPLAARFRTAMTLSMFAIIVLTLVYMSEISYMFAGRAQEISRNLSGGFGIELLSNPTNPVPARELAALRGVREVAPLGYVYAEFRTPRRDRTIWPATGIGPELASAPPALQLRDGYPSDRAAWQAVLEDPGLAIVDDFFLQTPGGPSEKAARVGDHIVMSDPLSGRERRLRVVAIAENDFLNSGAFVSQGALSETFGARAVESRYFVAARDPDATVRRIRTTFVSNGADASTVRSIVDLALSQQSGFFTLMQQFVGVGLLVGVAGIGVVMFRAVRERRRAIGVLRSLGFQATSVTRTFLFEAGFVATLGVAIGVLIALVATYVLAISEADFAEGFRFGVPVTDLLIIVSVALVPAVLAAVFPARRASRIRPAVALRVQD